MKRLPAKRPADQASLSDLFSPTPKAKRPLLVADGEATNDDTSGLPTVTRASASPSVDQVSLDHVSIGCDIGQMLANGEIRSARSLGDCEKLRFLRHHFVPGADYSFLPREEKKKDRMSKRYFQASWLRMYSWLVFSPWANGGFCLPCVFFAPADSTATGPLFNKPLTCFTKGSEALKKHAAQKTHLDSLAKQSGFLSKFASGEADVIQMLRDQNQVQAEENMQKLRSILACIEFCGRQGIPLRGHREDGFTLDKEQQLTSNPGNFLALVRFRAHSGDDHLLREFHQAGNLSGRHAVSYLSPFIQNELISCVAEELQSSILEEVRAAPHFSVLADEAADCSNKEQLPLVLRFVDRKNQIREELIDVLLCDEGVTGEALSGLIDNTLQSYNLNMTHFRGQGYDGAGNMSGRLRGCAARLLTKYEKALYMHCNSHCLNLCIVHTTNISLVQQFWSVMKEVNIFYEYSPKRAGELGSIVNASGLDSSKRKLVSLCKTRWTARHSALVTFKELLPAVLQHLEEIDSDGLHAHNADTVTKGRGLLASITSFRFIATFVIVSKVMVLIQSLTISLQEKALDVCRAYQQVDGVQWQVKACRDNIDEKFEEWWNEVEQLSGQCGVNPSIPRRCGRQTQRDNMPADTPRVYYRRVVAIPLLDDVLAQFKERFSPLQKAAVKGLYLVPSVIVCSQEEVVRQAVMEFGQTERNVLPTGTSIETLAAELDRWIQLSQALPPVQSSSCGPQLPACNSPKAALALARNSVCPCIASLLELLCVWPVTTCECERSVSALGRVKTALRSTMSQDRFKGIVLLHVHYSKQLEYKNVIRRFIQMHPRRIVAPNLGEDVCEDGEK